MLSKKIEKILKKNIKNLYLNFKMKIKEKL